LKNPVLDEFMASFKFEGLTFNDVSLVTQYADFLPDQASVVSRFSRNVPLNIPFVSAAMDTVTEGDMAIAVALMGGIGVIHKNNTIEEQATEVSRVKHYLNGLIADPVVFKTGMTIAEILAEKEKNNYQFTGFPVIDSSGKVVGIVTARDFKFVTDHNVLVDDVMTRELVTAPEGTSTKKAFEIMVSHRIGKLPLVDKNAQLVGLYSFHDVQSIASNIKPVFNRDDFHQLRVAAAVGPYDEDRLSALVDKGVDAVIIDTAHGHSKGVVETVKMIKKATAEVDVVAGNIATAEGARALVDAGADAVKVGVGPGSICTTRVVAGVGVPQLTAVYNVRQAVGDEVPVISDGGICYSGDVAKAVAVGADCVMMGSVLAGTDESPGEKILHQGRTYIVYRGMGSLDAMRVGQGSRERYGQGHVTDPGELVPQGIEGLVPYRGKVADVLLQFVGGVRFSLGYCGVRSLPELQEKARFVRVTSAGLREAHPHDIKIIKDAPNYQSN
jgi:IMP dehydrogenase